MVTGKERIARIEKIYNTVKSANLNGRTIEEEQLIAIVGLEIGAERRKIREYLNMLILAKRLIRVDGNIYTKENYEDCLEIAKVEEQINSDDKKGGDDEK